MSVPSSSLFITESLSPCRHGLGGHGNRTQKLFVLICAEMPLTYPPNECLSVLAAGLGLQRDPLVLLV